MAADVRAAAFSGRSLAKGLAACCALVAAALLFGLIVGPTKVDFGRVFAGDDSLRDLFKVLEIRLPKACAALIVGGCLAVAGVIFQALIHNPLASPYVLGVSAGGSLGAVIALALGFVVVVPFAFVGSLLAITIVYFVARRGGRVPADTLLLGGVVLNAFFSACIMFVTYTTGSDRTLHIMRWLVGGLSEVYDGATLIGSGILLLALAVAAWAMGRPLNLLAVSDDTAERLGVDVGSLRRRLFFVGSFLTAVAVSIAGPIGFVGLIIPHILRMVVGADHRLLIPLTMLAGGAFLAFADTIAGVVWKVPLPVGLVTAFVGAPFFVWLMRTRDPRKGGHGF